jgi:hypothetical protein
VLDPTLPTWLIEEEAVFELLSGRVLDKCEGARVLIEAWDVPRKFDVCLTPGQRDLALRVRGGLVGPIYFTRDLNLRIF